MNMNQIVLEWNKCKEDKIYFIEKYCNVFNIYDGEIDSIKLYDYQKDFINKSYIQVRKARQIGFSLLAYLNILHSIIFNTEKTITYFSYNNDAATVGKNIIVDLYNLCTFPHKPSIVENNKQTLKFDNCNTILVSRYNESRLRGISVDEIYIDEYEILQNSNCEESVEDVVVPIVKCRKDTKIWLWSTKSNNSKNVKIKGLDYYHLPIWATDNAIYSKIKFLSLYLSPEDIKREYLI